MPVPVLRILGASYGLADYTDTLGDFVDSNQEVHINTPGSVLADPWPGHPKSLAVTYQYGNEQPGTAVVADDHQLSITYTQGPVVRPPSDPTQLQIIGASYGPLVVTARVQALVQNNTLLLTANDATFNSSRTAVVPTFSVVYRFGAGAPMVKTCLQNQPLRLWPASDYAAQVTDGAWAYDTAVAYPDATSDLTLEAWVQTSTGGPVLSLTAVGEPGLPPFYETLALGVFASGALGLRLTSQGLSGGSSVGAMTGPSPVCDGEWHHLAAVRAGTVVSLLIDGVAQPVTLDPPAPSAVVPIGTAATLSVAGRPATVTHPLDFGAAQLTGLIDEVRLWNVARTPQLIALGMHHQLSDAEPGLIRHWSFDDQTLTDSSAAATTLEAVGQVSFVPSGLDIEPAGSPYLITQAQLMEDYLPNAQLPGQFTPIRGYRVIVSARDGDDNPRQTDLTFWASDPAAPASIAFFDKVTHLITDQASITRTTNAQGEISFVIDAINPADQAVDNPLLCPVLKVNADFMQPAERLVIAPDRHVHATLAGLTGDQLTGQAPLPSGTKVSLVGPTITAAQADAVAQAIGSVMSTAVDHTVQPERPLVRKRDAAIDLPLAQPYTPVYENIAMLSAPYDFTSNAIATHFLPADQPVTRVLVAESMSTPYWRLSVDGSGVAEKRGVVADPEPGFAPLSLEQRNAAVAGLDNSSSDPLAQLFGDGVAATVTLSQLDQLAAAEVTLQKRNSSGESFWDFVTTASTFIVSTTETTISDTGQVVKGLLVDALNEAKQRVSIVLQTVEHAVDFVANLLKRFGAKLVAVVDAIKALFNWSDILVSQQVVMAVLAQLPELAKSALGAMESRAARGLNALQAEVSGHFADWMAALGQGTFNSGTAPGRGQPPQDIQSKYLVSAYSDNIGGAQDDPNPEQPAALSQSDLASLQEQFPQNSLPDLQGSNTSLGLSSYVASPGAFLNALLSDLLAGVETLIVDFIELLTTAVEVVFEVLEDLIDSVLALCRQRIVIPFVTDFYEKVVVQNTSKFSLVSLLALITAIPFTITCKLASGKPGPVFSQADVAAVQDPNWELWADLRAQIQSDFGATSGNVAAKRDQPEAELANAASASAGSVLKSYVTDCICGFGYSASTLMWGVNCYQEDSLYPVPAPVAIVKTKLCNQLFANVFGLPAISLPPGVDKSATARYIIWGIWAGGVGALLSNTAAAMTSCWGEPYGDPLVTGLYGVAQLGLYIWLATIVGKHDGTGSAVFDAVLGLGESFEWVPQLLKPVGRLFPEFMGDEAAGAIAARTEVCAYMLVTAATGISAGAATLELVGSLGDN